ncbi:discoidin domain-containing protein [Flagellimonas sp. S3867]|uniref:discoidin domain-containing protein n=1 Tax=Flagellimonas sp. S3867 TaxID=2768063 RepID=UPI001684B143|nr:discoidin domain-containing protein [Flagellimonas sp. S3867]
MRNLKIQLLFVLTFYMGFIQAQEISIVASSSSADDGNVVSNSYDNDLNTRWSAYDHGQWAQFDLGSSQNFNEIQIAFYAGSIRTSTFDIQVSNDGSNWTTVQNGLVSSGVTTELESFALSNQNSRYIRYLGFGNSVNGWNSLTEVKIINNIVADTQTPTAPTLLGTAQTDTTADLSWSGATDNVGVTGYKIFKDGNLEATLNNVTTYQVTGLTASTTYSFTASALDAAGNESSTSSAVSVTTNTSSGGGSGSSIWSESNSVASYTGDIAVGTTTVPAGYKMAIDGKLITEEVLVQLSGNWPDYVFKEGYDLPTLEEIQKHIKEKGHLPNIPSATEVKANGIELGEMNRLLLEKIEELTLYILQLKEEINLLKNK